MRKPSGETYVNVARRSDKAAKAPRRRSALEELQKVGIDRLCMRGRHAVREVFVGLEPPVLQQFGRQWSGCDVGNDLIVLAVHHQHRHA